MLISSSLIDSPDGQPSIIQPTLGQWDSPYVVTLKREPTELICKIPDFYEIKIFVKLSIVGLEWMQPVDLYFGGITV